MEFENEKREKLKRVDLIERLAEKGYTKRAAQFIWTDVIAVLEEAFVEGRDVIFSGFGQFHLRDYKDRSIVHPATRERTIIPAHRTVRFVPGERLKDELSIGFVRK